MPRSAHDQESLSGLFKQIAGEGIDLAQAELSLARAEAAGLTKSYVVGIALCLIAFALSIASLVILGEAAAAAVALYTQGEAFAHFIVGVVMLVATVVLVFLGITFLTRKYKPVGAIFKWLAGQQVKL